jgi:signal transduction histidine kinase/ligand-binding sensor domain-containing protein
MRMEGRSAIAFVIFLACPPCASALNPSLDINQFAHKAWTVREGFFKDSINAIAQTPDGYLWLGTGLGLVRFDGVAPVPWQSGDGQQIPSNFIRSVLAARDGRLWIGTRKGIASLKDGKLTQYPEMGSDAVLFLSEDREGSIWFGRSSTPQKLCAIRNGSQQCYGEDDSFGPGPHSLYEDSAGTLWVRAFTGLWRWKPGPAKFHPMDRPSSILDAGDGALLIATASGIRRLVDGKDTAWPLPGVVGSFAVTRLLRDRNGGLWVGTIDRGILHVHEGHTDAFTQSDGLTGNFIGSLFEDREGDIWVGTADGLDRFREYAIPTMATKQGLSNGNVMSVLAAKDGSVWLATLDGLDRWKDRHVTIYRRQNGLPDNIITSLFEDDGGRIWAGTNSGVAYFGNGRFTTVSGLPSEGASSIAEDRPGSIWVSEAQAFFHLVEGRVVEQIPWDRLGRGGRALALIPGGSQGGLWLGFIGGGIAYFREGQIRLSYTAADGLGEGRVEGLELDRDGTLWAATESGLSRLKNGRAVTLTSRNGLPCDNVHWIMEDDARSAWLYTACGLVRIARTELDAWASDSKRTVQTTVFDTSDGVRSSSLISDFAPEVARTADGKLWFLPLDGVSIIDPRNLSFNKLPPPVHIEEITADRKTYETSSNLHLPPLVRDLEIDYTALSLVAPEKIRFKYQLEGRDPDWKDMGTERKAYYTDLPPRNYRFRVKACNNSGVWNEAGASFDFSIDPTYYQTAWFKIACAAAFLTLLLGIYRLRLYQLAREFNVRLEERVGERTRIARDLHDTLLQSFQGMMLRLQAGIEVLPPSKTKEALEKALERGDQAIAEGRESIHDLRSSTTITNELAQALRSVADELAGDGSPTFRLVVEGPVRELHPILRDEVYRIAREGLRNAFNHAQAHHIEAEITYGERLLRLRIRDDGRGIPAETLESGRSGHYGLSGMRERARQAGASLDIWSSAGTGTEIDLSIPGSIAYGKSRGRSRLQLFRKKVG